jgi:hypothetical protein
MKKTIALILISAIFLVSCDENILIQVRRTVTKTIVLNYDINGKGSFSQTSFINSDHILRQFDKEAGYFGSKIEKLDIHDFKFGAAVDARNTAQTLVLSAVLKNICYSGSGCSDIKILDDTRTIQIQSSVAMDVLTGLGAVVGIDKTNLTLHNAIASVNATGAAAIKKVLENAFFKEGKFARIDVELNGKVPSNQQVVLKATIVMNASLTYIKCEEAYAGIIFGGDSVCK